MAILLTGCRDENVQFIQGNWANGDVHYYSEWIFDRGSYVQQSTIGVGNNQYQSGNYQVIESDGDSLILELYNKTVGDPLEDRTQIKIQIDRDNDAIKIGRNTYFRVINRTLEEVQEGRQNQP
jgi:hypothetical protein